MLGEKMFDFSQNSSPLTFLTEIPVIYFDNNVSILIDQRTLTGA